MPELTQEEKLKIFENLSEKLQDFMRSEDTGAFLLYLGEKYNLDDEKIHLLSKLLGDVILGILPKENLVSEITTQITPDQQIAAVLAKELNDLIVSAEAGLSAPVAPEVPEAPAVIDLRKSIVPPAVSQFEPPPPPEIIDLRKTLPPPMPAPISPAPIPPKPLTFTKPIMPSMPLIEASPHENLSRLNLDRSADTYREKIEDSPLPPMPPKPSIPTPKLPIVKPPIAKSEEIARPKEPEESDKPFILRPPGFPPVNINE